MGNTPQNLVFRIAHIRIDSLYNPPKSIHTCWLIEVRKHTDDKWLKPLVRMVFTAVEFDVNQ